MENPPSWAKEVRHFTEASWGCSCDACLLSPRLTFPQPFIHQNTVWVFLGSMEQWLKAIACKLDTWCGSLSCCHFLRIAVHKLFHLFELQFPQNAKLTGLQKEFNKKMKGKYLALLLAQTMPNKWKRLLTNQPLLLWKLLTVNMLM